MLGALRHHPGIARVQQKGLAFEVQFGTPLDDVANGFVLAAMTSGRGSAGGSSLPETHGDMDAAGEIFLAELPSGEASELTLVTLVSFMDGSGDGFGKRPGSWPAI